MPLPKKPIRLPKSLSGTRLQKTGTVNIPPKVVSSTSAEGTQEPGRAAPDQAVTTTPPSSTHTTETEKIKPADTTKEEKPDLNGEGLHLSKPSNLALESRLLNVEIANRKTPRFSPTLELLRSSQNFSLTASQTGNPDEFASTNATVKKPSMNWVYATLVFYAFGAATSYYIINYKMREEMKRREDERKWAELVKEYELLDEESKENLKIPAKPGTELARYLRPDKADEVFKETEKQTAETYNTVAETYDDTIGKDESWLGLTLMRRWLLARHAEGNVLEVGSGTGRNFAYYKPKYVKSVTCVDRSPAMLEVAARKAVQKYGKNTLTENAPTILRVKFEPMDAEDLKFPDAHFDTVVSTFTLCSFGDPVQALQEMARVCKPDGKIIMLEHGKAGNGWPLVGKKLDELLDKSAKKHQEKWGCEWNRNIMGAIHEAGLEVDVIKRWHFGTTYYVVAKPPLPASYSPPQTSITSADKGVIKDD